MSSVIADVFCCETHLKKEGTKCILQLPRAFCWCIRQM